MRVNGRGPLAENDICAGRIAGPDRFAGALVGGQKGGRLRRCREQASAPTVFSSVAGHAKDQIVDDNGGRDWIADIAGFAFKDAEFGHHVDLPENVWVERVGLSFRRERAVVFVIAETFDIDAHQFAAIADVIDALAVDERFRSDRLADIVSALQKALVERAPKNFAFLIQANHGAVIVVSIRSWIFDFRFGNADEDFAPSQRNGARVRSHFRAPDDHVAALVAFPDRRSGYGGIALCGQSGYERCREEGGAERFHKILVKKIMALFGPNGSESGRIGPNWSIKSCDRFGLAWTERGGDLGRFGVRRRRNENGTTVPFCFLQAIDGEASNFDIFVFSYRNVSFWQEHLNRREQRKRRLLRFETSRRESAPYRKARPS